MRNYLTRRSGVVKLQEANFTYVGGGALRNKNLPITITQETFTGEIQSIPNSADMWEQRRRKLYLNEIRERQCKLGESFWPATASRPDICVGPPALAAKVNHKQACDVYRIDDLIRTAKERKGSPVLTPN